MVNTAGKGTLFGKDWQVFIHILFTRPRIVMIINKL